MQVILMLVAFGIMLIGGCYLLECLLADMDDVSRVKHYPPVRPKVKEVEAPEAAPYGLEVEA